MKPVNQQLLENVTGAYEMLTQELSKPQEDVVAISVCGATRGAIENVLRLYLESKGTETKSVKSIEDLEKLCVQDNNKFKRFDFTPVNCRCETMGGNSMSYCLGEDKIDSCYRLFVELKGFIFEELKIN